MLDRILRKSASLLSKDSVRSVGTLLGGTAVAQMLVALALPVLTRLYTPTDFSVLAIFASLLAIVSVAACLRFDVAIPLPKNDRDAANLLALALGFSALSGIGLAGLVAFSPNLVVAVVHDARIAPHLWVLPIGVWLASSYAALQFWATRKKAFKAVAKTRITQAVGAIGAQVSFGMLGVAPLGLLLGQVLNSGAGILGLAKHALRNDRKALSSIRLARMRRQFSLYSRYPKYSTFEAVGNISAIQVPVIMVAAYAAGPEAGFLMLAMRAMQAPMAVLGGAVSQVYLSRAPDEFRAGNLGPFTLNVVAKLGKAGAGPLIFAGVTAPMLFPIIFGGEWVRAGWIVCWMTPWFVIQFISAPVAASLHVIGRQRSALVLQLFGLVLRVAAVAMAIVVSPDFMVEAFALSSFLFHSTVFIAIIRMVEIPTASMLKALGRSLPIVFGWLILACAALFIFGWLRASA